MILVTGATGLVGSHLLFELLTRDYNVKALVREHSDKMNVLRTFAHYSKDAQALYNKIIWVPGDVTDIYSLYEAMEGVKTVYHTAAVVSFNTKDYPLLKKVNAQGTAHVVNACIEKKIEKLCYTSSVAALGREDSGTPLSEDTPWSNKIRVSAYAKSKYEAEQEVWRGIAEGLNAVMVNPSIIIGPGDRTKGSSKLIETVAAGQLFYTKGVNGFVDVRDVARIMVLLMESNITSERFLLSSENLSYKELLDTIAKHLNVKAPRFYGTPFLSEMAWRLGYVMSLFTRKKPLITKETAHTAHNKHFYSNNKVKNLLQFEFISVDEAVKNACR